MSKKIVKTFPVIVALNETAWYTQEKDSLGSLSVKARWNLKKNIKEFEKISTEFIEFREGLENEISKKYFGDDERSEPAEITDKDGNKQNGRKVKKEFVDEYNKDIEEVNRKLQELLYDEEEVEIYIIDMDAEIERMPDDAVLSDKAMDMLSIYEDATEGND